MLNKILFCYFYSMYYRLIICTLYRYLLIKTSLKKRNAIYTAIVTTNKTFLVSKGAGNSNCIKHISRYIVNILQYFTNPY